MMTKSHRGLPMTIFTEPTVIKKRRSNKLHTAAAVKAVEEYLDGSARSYWKSGNTKVLVDSNSVLTVSLYENLILELKPTPRDMIYNVIVHGGDFYDNDGNPSRMTQERLNGLFDCLEASQIIPEGIRIYKDKESGVCLLSDKKQKIPFNRNYCHSMAISINSSDPSSLFTTVES